MPNWCYTSLMIQGSDEDLDAIEKAGLDFERILPTPPHLLGWPRNRVARLVMRLCGIVTRKNPTVWPKTPAGDGWYDWRDEHWGTKWTAADVDVRRTPEGIEARMFTAYGPPIPMLRHLTSEYDVLIHTYNEYEGGGFVGTQTFSNGEIIDDDIDSDIPEVV